MPQVYALSVVCNAAAGWALVHGCWSASTRLALGALAAAAGVLTALSPAAGNPWVLGDAVPALAGLLAGAALALEHRRVRAGLPPDDGTGIAGSLLRHRKAAGFLSLAAAALHFLFPQALLL